MGVERSGRKRYLRVAATMSCAVVFYGGWGWMGVIRVGNAGLLFSQTSHAIMEKMEGFLPTISSGTVLALLGMVLLVSCKEPGSRPVSVSESEEEQHVYYYGICADTLDLNEYRIKKGETTASIHRFGWHRLLRHKQVCPVPRRSVPVSPSFAEGDRLYGGTALSKGHEEESCQWYCEGKSCIALQLFPS